MPVTKRKVFYLSGFDPRGARHYYQWYRDAAARYTGLTAEPIEVSPREGDRWTITHHSAHVATEYHFLAWDDIVRKAWIRNPLMLVLRCLGMYGYYIRHFRWHYKLQLPRPPLITFFSPLAILLAVPFGLSLLGWIILPYWAALSLGIAASIPFASRLKSLWLLRLLLYNTAVAKAHTPDLMKRIDQFAESIGKALADGTDEILLVGHSNGAILMIYLLDRLLAQTGGTLPPQLRVLTLGQCIPIISVLDNAADFSAALSRVAQVPLYWCDIVAPPDGAAYARTSPFFPDHPHHAATLVLLNPRFFDYHTPEHYQRLRRDRHRFHFRYLMTGDAPSPLDYVALTAGANTLVESVAEFQR